MPKKTPPIPFNRPYVAGRELEYARQATLNLHLSGDGPFTDKCQGWLEQRLGCEKALLTHSCTGALEMAALLAEIQPGDEIIMPSYTFVSTANAFVLRGGIPVFIDIRSDTLNIDETKIEDAVTPRTRAIVVVHYAGVSCEMDPILEIADRRGLLVIEDAAQGILASYRERPLGGIAPLAAFSFHETKNVISGEGGALLINDRRWIERAEILREKGTNRSQFFRGEVDKYTWLDVGSSYLPSEINAAFLWAQLEAADAITEQRMRLWRTYQEGFVEVETAGKVKRPSVPPHCRHNGQIYYLRLPDLKSRTRMIEALKKENVHTVFHYVPLHSSPAGKKFGRTHGSLQQTEAIADQLVRLPMWIGMTEDEVTRVIESVGRVVQAM